MNDDNYKVFQLNHLLETTNSISKAKDFEGISEIIFDFIESLIDYDMAVIYNIDWDIQGLEVISCRGSDVKELKKRVHIKFGQGAVGWVAREKKVLSIDDVFKTNQIQVRQFYEKDPLIRSFLAVPLIVGNKLIGILSISCSKPNQFSIKHIEMITIIASQGAALLQLNNEINEAKRFSNYILDNINSGVIAIDRNYNIIVFNKSAEEITGYSFDEIIKKKIFDLPFKESLEDWKIFDCLGNQKILYEERTYLINKQGEKLSIQLSTSLIEKENQKIDGCICIFRDNTETEKFQRQVIKAEKLAAIGKLTSGITHEIRNPLLPIMTASEFLISKTNNNFNNEETIKLLDIIYKESKRLNRFLDQFSIMDNKNLSFDGKALIIESLEETILLINPSLKERNILLIKKHPKQDFYLNLPKDQIKQIFLNLILNAIDSINEKDDNQSSQNNIKVYISKDDKDNALIEIEDTGKGIKEEDITNIFDPFYSTKEKGTGLGLPIINNLITAYGGKVLVESQYGKGSKFSLVIPISKIDQK